MPDVADRVGKARDKGGCPKFKPGRATEQNPVSKPTVAPNNHNKGSRTWGTAQAACWLHGPAWLGGSWELTMYGALPGLAPRLEQASVRHQEYRGWAWLHQRSPLGSRQKKNMAGWRERKERHRQGRGLYGERLTWGTMELMAGWGGHSKNSNWFLESRKAVLGWFFFFFTAVTNTT